MHKLIIIVFLFLTTQISKAQELESIILAADDASKLTENYISPVMKGFMYSMNGGWYTTAKTHQQYGFDVTINANVSFVPSSDEVFQFIQSEYAYLSLPNGETSISTVLGNDNETTVDVSVPVTGEDNSFKVASFNMPGGIGSDLPLKGVPTPMIQVGFGLPKKTDIKLRFVPKLNLDEVETNLIGIGIQHDLIQYFNEPDYLPFHVSLLGAFTNMKVAYNIEGNNALSNIDITDGEAEFKMNTWTVQLLGSLDFKLITFYTSLGYNAGSSKIEVNGEYNLTYNIEDDNGVAIGSVEESVTDPINLGFDANGLRATLGTRLNLGFFKIFGDYTLQEYNTLSAGIAFSFK